MAKFLFGLACIVALKAASQTTAQEFYERPGVSAKEILLARGYQAEEVYIISKDGYKLQLVHSWNPLIANDTRRVPILFVHGILSQANNFLINSFHVKPRDFTSMNLSDAMSANKIASDPSARCLPMLAMNFGHHVWLLNKRGAPGSQTKLGRQQTKMFRLPMFKLNNFNNFNLNFITTTNWMPITLGAFTNLPAALLGDGRLLEQIPFSFDADFWNFSIDEQADYDFPLAVEYVSKQSGTKVAVVAHSEGGAIVMMSLSDRPEIARNMSSAILWAPAFSLGRANKEIIKKVMFLKSFFEAYLGSFVPAFSSTILEAILALVCSSALAQRTVCETVADLAFYGKSGGKEPLLSEFISALFYSSSSHELAQLLQNGGKFRGTMHKFDYGSNASNLVKYNQSEPPAYNATQVTLDNISFYVGRTDSLVSLEDVRYGASKLTAIQLSSATVPYDFHIINTEFNHVGYFFHDDNARLVIIPSLLDIQLFSAS